jgi:hypothetical protein
MPECEAWSSVFPVVAVGDDDDVGREGLAVLLQERAERSRPELLLPLDEQDDAEVEVGTEHLGDGPDRRDVGHHTGFVVGGAPPVEAAVADGRLEGRRLPLVVTPGRLDVVVRVEQHGGAPVAGLAPGEDGRLPELRPSVDGGAAHRDLVEDTETAGEFGDGLGRRRRGSARVPTGRRSRRAARPRPIRGAGRGVPGRCVDLGPIPSWYLSSCE